MKNEHSVKITNSSYGGDGLGRLADGQDGLRTICDSRGRSAHPVD